MRQRLATGEQVARMYQERDWPGWSAKPRSPRSWSPSARRHQTATTDVVVAPRRPLPCDSESGSLLACVHQERTRFIVQKMVRKRPWLSTVHR
jgi:hypothetical protein